MSQCLEDLLQQCTVKLTISGVSHGTGFFVAPGLILTCAHVVNGLGDKSIQVRWQNQENWANAVVTKSIPDPYDLALLRVTLPLDVNPPCVYLGKPIKSRDPLYLFGYPDRDFPDGCAVTVDYEGLTGDSPALMKFTSGQIRSGISGSPLLNQRTGEVCGIVKFTLGQSSNLGGGAVPTSLILTQFPDIVEQQRSFHQQDRRWNNLTEELFDDEAEMRQNNFDDTTNYQVRTGADNNTYIGGVHNHNVHSSPEQPIVKNILLLSANPENTTTSRKRTGIKEIRDALKRANHGQLLDVQERLETSAVDISQSLSEIEPFIVNISGCEDGIEGLILDGIHNENVLFDKKETLIADLFQNHSNNIKCIVLNSCYSEKQAKEIIRHIEFIIGISQNLEDKVVVDFLTEFYYQLGSKRTIINSYDQSCNLLKRTGTNPDWLPILLNKQDEIRRNDLERDLTLCNLEIENNRNNVNLWAEKANLLTQLDRTEEADAAYEQASLLQPTNPEFKTKQGDLLEKSGNYEGAIVAYDKALELEKEDYRVWWKKGQALVEIKKYFEAEQSYCRAVALNPPSPDSYMIFREYGFILKELDRYQLSIISYKKSLSVEPRYRVSSYEKRQVYKKIYFGDD
jgi:tetratricopeptide (TPR) repeat protein